MATTNAQTFTIGGVTHQVEDTTARAGVASLQTALASLQSALDTLMGTDDITDEIDTYNEIKQFLDGFDTDDPNLSEQLTTLFTNVNDLLAAMPNKASATQVSNLQTAVENLQTALAGKVDAVNGKGLSTNDYTNEDKAAVATIANKANSADVYPKSQTYTKDEVDALIDNIEAGESIVTSVDNVAIVDNMQGANADTILAAGSARALKEMYVNLKALYQNLAGVAFIGAKPTWQTVARRTYTIGMASADQYITLTDGNGNAVSSPQDEGTPLTLRLSVANGYRFADVPTATMGSTNITFSLVGNVYVAEIGALSGNVVITASSTQVGTYSVSIPTGAVFCTSSGAETTAPSINEGEGVTCYIKPADGKRWATTPTSSAATVTLQSGSIYKIVASNVQADITVNGSTESIPTYAINLPSAGNGIASVALTDANNNAIQSPVLEGAAVKIVLTPSPNYRINVTSAKMGQQDLTPTNVNGVLTYTIASVTGDIQITATAAEFGKVNVSKILRNMVLVSDNTDANGKIAEGSTYTATLETAPMVTEEIAGKSPSTLPLYGNNIVGIWAAPTVVVKKGGVEVVGAYNSSTGVVTVNNVDDDIDVFAITEPKVFQDTHPAKDNSTSEIYAEAYTNSPRPFGVNSIYAHIPNGCTKIRWYHAAHETDMNYDSKTGRVFIPTFKGSNGLEWATMLSQPTMGGQGGQKFPFNYVDISFTAPSSEKKDFVYMMALFNQNHLSDCFLVDITNVDSSALAAADAAAATAAGESGTQIVSASLDAIVDLGGNIIFDGRYSELTTLPSE